MNREVKFRAWDKIEKRFFPLHSLAFRLDGTLADISLVKDNDPLYTPDSIVLMQFTGLKDKNGKECFEGDIIEHNDTRLQVEPIIPVDRFYGSYDTPSEDDWMSMSDVDWEVIGNIYENPEPLKP